MGPEYQPMDPLWVVMILATLLICALLLAFAAHGAHAPGHSADASRQVEVHDDG
jgi:hypothetical protein